MQRTSLKSQWIYLRNIVDEIELEIAASHFPAPSKLMCDLLIAGEDHRLPLHPGVDPIALCRALWKTYFCGTREGASTIAMQLVRTISGCYEKTWSRKVQEIILAVRLTHHKDKQRLPSLYLWVAYYGAGMNNFVQACTKLGIVPSREAPLDAAKLVARLKYPQPRSVSIKRASQISNRARHLLFVARGFQQPIESLPLQEDATIPNSSTARNFF